MCMFFWLVPIVSGDDLVDIMHLNLPMTLHSSSDGVSTLEFHLCACFHASFDSVGCQSGNAHDFIHLSLPMMLHSCSDHALRFF